MELKSGNLDKWRDYFRTANSDIFNIIEHAIMVAASDCPKEFRLRRDRIAEVLFSCRLTRCFGCDRVELAVPEGSEDGGGCKSGCDGDGGSKDSKVNSSGDDQGKGNLNQVSNYSFGEAEALTDEIEEESQIVGEVLRIKEIVDNSEDESESVLFESLRRLQLMGLSVETLKVTEIGKAVKVLRKHASKEIRHLARMLIDGWMAMVDEWYSTKPVVGGTESTPESVNPSVLDEEEGLPSPPLDDLAFFATSTMELSQFFDGMDDDGSELNVSLMLFQYSFYPRNGGENNKNRQNGGKPPMENHNVPKWQQQLSVVSSTPPKDKGEQVKNFVKPNKPAIAESGRGRTAKPSVEQKVHSEAKFQQKSERLPIQRRPLAPQQDKPRCSDEAAVQVKLEVTKRKLQESYQQVENAKKQRTIQVMELHDIPKQGLGHKNPQKKPGSNHNRHCPMYWKDTNNSSAYCGLTSFTRMIRILCTLEIEEASF
ncbi:hypothetical protein RJ639_039091 [Escallonia herrerae]|uniref:TFIIS N-terminal domain-containing protein n=1 Tax=Escallonia herrerae TaxID=1293975 RepID=A0AA88WHL4_9ASTE|nr:hypothetical protein RJ639_039091 [Escallonia herrerae]